MLAWIVAVLALIAGLIVGYLVCELAAKRELTAAKNDLAQARAESAAHAGFERLAEERAANIAQLTAECTQLRSELSTKTDIETAKILLSSEFKALSADNIRDANEQLAKAAETIIARHQEITVADVKLHRQHIETILKPVEETIQRLDKHVADSDSSRTRAEALLDEQIKRLAGASESLTNALSKPVVRGSWGEMTLENALENAGLEPEIDFILQDQTDAEDGQKRTDAVVNLPKGRKLIIDSKNLMETYLAFANAQDESQKAVLGDLHSKSLRRHIKALSAKEYWRRYEGLDCVILFIPHDGMYHAAIRDESDLIREACDKRVFVANPMTLIPLLKAVRYVLDQERLNKNAEEIKEVGADLYVELTRFAGNMSTVGDKLHDAVKAYNGAIPGLDRYILAKSRKLKQLGSSKGPEPELPGEVDLEPRTFSSKELRHLNLPLEENSVTAMPGLALAPEAVGAADDTR
jgi:DNA recombination protein RmuC